MDKQNDMKHNYQPSLPATTTQRVCAGQPMRCVNMMNDRVGRATDSCQIKKNYI